MPIYISLMSFTDQGIRNVKESPARLDTIKERLRKMGGKMKDFYLTFGPYDGVAIVELPDDETAARFALGVGALGNIRTTTLTAFAEDQYRGIIGGLQ
jgi:uncharacterized protein with GYD domain